MATRRVSSALVLALSFSPCAAFVPRRRGSVLPLAGQPVALQPLALQQPAPFSSRRSRGRVAALPVDAVAEAVAASASAADALLASSSIAAAGAEPDAGILANPMLLAFSDQKGTLAGVFFQGSLPPYLAFLYFLGFEGNKAPKLTKFGFAFLLLFVAATIPTGIISKGTFGCSLADVDWLHGGAESLLTVSNVLAVLGLRSAFLAQAEGQVAYDAEGPRPADAPVSEGYDDSLLRYGALATAAVVGAFCASGVGMGFEAHTQFLAGIGNLPVESLGLPHAEPVNALSIPTWAVHFSSVFEFVFAMSLVWRWAEATKNPAWKGVAWGMLPSHASGVAACTYHLFFNAAAVGWLVTLQAGLTALGNTTLAIACYRLAVSNGWSFSELDPRLLLDEARAAEVKAGRTAKAAQAGNPAALNEVARADALEALDAELAELAELGTKAAEKVAAAPQAELTLPGGFTLKLPQMPPPPSSTWGASAGATAAASSVAGRREALEEAWAGEAAELTEAAKVRSRDLESEALLAAKLVGATLLAAYATKYGALALDFPFEATNAAAALVVALPPLAVAGTLLANSPDLLKPKALGGDNSEDGEGESSGMQSLSMADIKKFGASGTLAYVLTELVFWAVAFPVASTTFYNTAGHWPDFGDNADRATVLGFVFAGANIARLAVPLRLGAALALAPWVDENILQRFGGAEKEEEI